MATTISNKNEESVNTTTSVTGSSSPSSSSSSSKSIYKKITSYLTLSCGATFLMIFYMCIAFLNLYHLMYPLARYDIKKFNTSPKNIIKPLWSATDDIYMRIYLSTQQKFDLSFIQSDYIENSMINNDNDNNSNISDTKKTKATMKTTNHRLLWDEKVVDSSSFSKSFLLTSCPSGIDCSTNNDKSYQYATKWLDETEKNAIDELHGGIIHTLSSAGRGIESTSAILTLYNWFGTKLSTIKSLLTGNNIEGLHQYDDANVAKLRLGILNRTTIVLPPESPMWQRLHSNTTVYIHVLLVRKDGIASSIDTWPPATTEDAMNAIRQASVAKSLLIGQVDMIKYDKPHHIHKPRRILWHDVRYLYRKHIMLSREMPPWVMEISKPEEHAAYQYSLDLKKNGSGYPYWKPEVSIKYINDVETAYPSQLAHLSGMEIVQLRQQQHVQKVHPTGYALMPGMHMDEMGMTNDKYIPVNETITSLPLRITFDRNDIQSSSSSSTSSSTGTSTATSGGMSPARWRLLLHLVDAIEKQKQLGFDQSDIDEIKRVIADTNITLLTITLVASTLHMLFEFLTFKNEVSFWSSNNDLTGLSVRSLFLDTIGQTIILIFLMEENSSLLTIIPSAIGCLIALWKCQRGSGLKLVKRNTIINSTQPKQPIQFWNIIPSFFGYEIRATRLETYQKDNATNNKTISQKEKNKDKLLAMTLEADMIATRYLGTILLPLVLGYTLHSFCYNEHKGWYSWIVSSAASAVYALGFVLMTPQLFLNYKLQSVAHLPWRVLVYKSLNTFIDDLFSFIIRMPTMARISCFRDDVVFFIYLYQRWLYPVDTSRPIEGGVGEREATTNSNATVITTTTATTCENQNTTVGKKNQ